MTNKETNPEREGKRDSVPASDGENSQSEKVCLSMADCFGTLFDGPQLSARNFERYYEIVKNAFTRGFRSVAQEEEYVKVFSSTNWKALSPAEKSRHSVSNCVGCSTQFAQLQKSFPVKPFYCPPEPENVNDAPTALASCHTSGVPFAELAANLGYKSPAQLSRIVNKTVKKTVCEAQKQCSKECSSHLDGSALQAVYATNVSKLKYEEIRRVQYLSPPSEANVSKKKRFPLQPHESDRYDQLCETLRSWETREMS